MDLEQILGNKSKIKMLRVFFSNPEALFSIHNIAVESKVPYSVAYKDIHEFLKSGIVSEEKKKVRLNTDSEIYEKLKDLFPEQKSKAITEFIELIKDKEAVIILHKNADLDAVGSGIALARALAQLKVKTGIFSPEGISRQSSMFMGKYPYPLNEKTEKFPGLIFTVDCSNFSQTGNIRIPEKSRLIVIDHHEYGELSEKADIKFIDRTAHSSAVVVHKLIKDMGLNITKEIAFFLMCAIVAETGFLRLVGRKDFIVISELLDKVNIEDVFAAISVEQPFSEKIAVLKAARRLKIYTFGKTILVFSRIGSFEAAAARNFLRLGADIAIVENIRKKEMRISARAKIYMKERLNLVEILEKTEKTINGTSGGHITAASANGKNTKASKEVRTIILKEIGNKLGIAGKML